ncbi:serine hydrolase [Lapillicoccus jejuensis]|uniref:Beta-lactamase class A n=1 Tax=Lapillicoccus jejuensis TaxID=402171 RepID=A0A542DYA0_9MICO|nr:serine hydrolase [Lapillicoccus jejuensis]TQJ07904.1 beta-lactamase class A [Lapillicoccus jejuensis]
MRAAPRLPEDGSLRWSALVVGAGGEVLLSHEPGRVLRTASVGKLLLLLEVDRRAEEGSLEPDRPVPRPVDGVRDSGLWHAMAATTLSVGDLAVLVGSVSDNLATNALLRLVGLGAVDRVRAGLGLVDTALHDEVRGARAPDDPRTLSTGRADELVTLVRTAVARPRVRAWLEGGTDLSMVAGAFGLDPLAHREDDGAPYRLAHKTGTDDGVRADVGVVARPGRGGETYAVVANWAPADGDRTDEVLTAMHAVGTWLRSSLP